MTQCGGSGEGCKAEGVLVHHRCRRGCASIVDCEALASGVIDCGDVWCPGWAIQLERLAAGHVCEGSSPQ